MFSIWACEHSPYHIILCPVCPQKPHFGDVQTAAGRAPAAWLFEFDGGAEGSLKVELVAGSAAAGFGQSTSFDLLATNGRILLNNCSCHCRDRLTGLTAGGIVLFEKISKITKSV